VNELHNLIAAFGYDAQAAVHFQPLPTHEFGESCKEPFGPPSLRYYAIMFVKLSSNQATEEKYCLSWQVWWRFTSCECCLRKRRQQIGRPQASRGNMIWTIFVDSRQGDNCCKLFLFSLVFLFLFYSYSHFYRKVRCCLHCSKVF